MTLEVQKSELNYELSHRFFESAGGSFAPRVFSMLDFTDPS
jgi:hypothetical protein